MREYMPKYKSIDKKSRCKQNHETNVLLPRERKKSFLQGSNKEEISDDV